MNTDRKELEVAALENGTVIDHIPSNQLFKVVNLLKLDRFSDSITIGNNLASQRYGKKGIIKVAGYYFKEDELNKIALIAPNAVINIIHDYKVTEKRKVNLPNDIYGIVRCNNPKCITNNEPMETHFHVIDRENIEIKCHYCERTIRKSDIDVR
jgi:aspartate carbamoyltransferase, regulatory subunit